MPALPTASERITLPAPPKGSGKREFPLLATAAPVVGSLVMWAVTGSPFALVFAFLGPVIAVGTMVDARRHGRRHERKEAKRFSRDVDAVMARIHSAHRRERQALLARALHPHGVLASAARDPEWWRQNWGEAIPVCLGVGSIPSTLEVEAPPVGSSAEVEAAHARLSTAASSLPAAPVFIDARDGVGIVGPSTAAEALARSIVAQLGFLLSPQDSRMTADGDGPFGWALQLPHASIPACQVDRLVFRPTAALPEQVVCLVAADATVVPRECRVLIRLDSAGSASVERNPSGALVDRFRPWYVSEVQAEQLARLAADCATADGLGRNAGTLPDRVGLSELTPAGSKPGNLPAVFSAGESGPVVVDLVRDGPHAVVGGTTGSGKSELLVSWILALATANSPAAVNFLLVDFKGGSSFAEVSALPHTVGLITDLDQAAARRALASLTAELRHRERVLAAAGARALDELTEAERMPRLVIIVDEFAVVVGEFPELQALFADLSARGRSLGIHLVLCTQRPAGVIRDSVLANCSLRLSLRVNNAADSVAVIGTSAAAELTGQPLGRCLLSVAGAAPLSLQVALARTDVAVSVIAQYADHHHPVRRPWLDPLPVSVSLPEVVSRCDEDGIPFGLIDVPESQSQPAAVYLPLRDGNLVVLGGMGSGKSAVLRVLRAAGGLRGARVVSVPTSVEGAWDVVREAALGVPGSDDRLTLLLLDDLDALVARLSPDHLPEFVDSLSRLLREGSGRNHRVVFTAARVTSSIQVLLPLCDSRLVLRMASRQEHLLAGGEGIDYNAELGPGGGRWRGHPVQVALVSASDPAGSPAPGTRRPQRIPWPPAAAVNFALVAPQPGALVERMRLAMAEPAVEIVDIAGRPANGADVQILAGDRARVLVGDLSAWQAQWSLFAAARANGPVILAGCNPHDFRILTGIRQLPPPIGPEPGGAWMLTGDSVIARIQLPDWYQGSVEGR
jgi:S-DNA-T family DNA segregation ATPase FtsK/SpoIIIE